jgi:hypothetical protein
VSRGVHMSRYFVWEMHSGGIKYHVNVFGGMHMFISVPLDIDITRGVHMSGGMNNPI